ncbi:hypothetical protein [Streptomyces sp. E5N298]|nr:hypothetical protein [Streptomyces sp. E5N298]
MSHRLLRPGRGTGRTKPVTAARSAVASSSMPPSVYSVLATR